MPDDCYQPEFPPEIEAKIQNLVDKTRASRDEVINSLMRAFFEIVDDPKQKNVPAFVEKVRKAAKAKNGIA